MARKPRPVDPADGPIPAFAYGLRAVREEAGNPTYRALAALAGFSATTLSDAAGGVRQPSLEVTLAYVGACGGDVELWQERWRELDRLLDQERGVAAAEARPAAAVSAEAEAALVRDEVGEVGALASPPARLPGAPWALRASWTRWPPRWQRSAVGVVAVLAAACVLLISQLSGAGKPVTATPSPSPTPLPHCAGTPDTPAAFQGATYLINTRIRAGASLNAPVIHQASGACTLEFTGYCLGDVVQDGTAGVPDMRWLEVSGGGVVSSSVIHGNPPASIAVSPCPDHVPPADLVSLSLAHLPGNDDLVGLQASGRNVAIVGYAAYFAPMSAAGAAAGSGSSGAGSPATTGSGTGTATASASATGRGTANAPASRWQQIGFSDTATSHFAVDWRLGPLRNRPAEQGPIPIVAVACLGGDGPTDILDALRIQPTTPASPQPITLNPTDRAAAELAACGYPKAG